MNRDEKIKLEKEDSVAEETTAENVPESYEAPEIPEEKRANNQGLVADAFDGMIPVLADQVEDDGKDCVTITYGFTAEEAKTALKIFQKNTIYKKNLIYSLIIGVLLVSYLLETVKTPSSKFNLFMSVICISVLGLIWYFPLRHIKSTVKAIAMQEYTEDYVLRIYDTYIRVGEGSGSARYDVVKDRLRAWENKELFVIGLAKERIFVVPKRCCQGREEMLSDLLKDRFGDHYRNLEK